MVSTLCPSGEVPTGLLVPLLAACTLEPADVHALFSSGPEPPPRFEHLVDYLGESMPSKTAPRRCISARANSVVRGLVTRRWRRRRIAIGRRRWVIAARTAIAGRAH